MKHLLSIEDLEREQVEMILERAESFAEVTRRDIKKVPTLRGRTVVTLFYESSTRTSSSFELAAKRLSADVVSVKASGSSVDKGESLKDTVESLSAYEPAAIVIRHPYAGSAGMLTEWVEASVINAGDGSNEHPTQALLDAFTIRQHCGSLHGLTVVIAGDIRHSRVARSNALLLSKMGATVRFVAPASLLPVQVDELNAESYLRLEPALEGADAVMMLRIQMERQKKLNFPSMREYFDFFALTPERLRLAKEGALVMHPGPMNRGVEIDSEVADGDQSVILEQVTNGVAIRMAILYLLAGGRSESAAGS